jgi:hypothetical protein
VWGEYQEPDDGQWERINFSSAPMDLVPRKRDGKNREDLLPGTAVRVARRGHFTRAAIMGRLVKCGAVPAQNGSAGEDRGGKTHQQSHSSH